MFLIKTLSYKKMKCQINSMILSGTTPFSLREHQHYPRATSKSIITANPNIVPSVATSVQSRCQAEPNPQDSEEQHTGSGVL